MQYVAWCRGNAGEIVHHAFLKNLVICVFVRNIVISSLSTYKFYCPDICVLKKDKQFNNLFNLIMRMALLIWTMLVFPKSSYISRDASKF